MATFVPSWVPDGAWLAPGYAEWGPPAALRGTTAVQKVLDVAGTLACAGTPDQAVTHMASLLRGPAARFEQVAGTVGLSERQLRRRFHAAVGYGPKTLQRVYRFQRFVQRADARRADERRVGDLRANGRPAGGGGATHRGSPGTSRPLPWRPGTPTSRT